MTRKLLPALLALVFFLPSYAQDKPEGFEDFDWRAHSARLYSEADMRLHYEKVKPADLGAWQQELRTEIKDVLGISRLERRLADFKPTGRMVEKEDCDFGSRERWIIWTEPDVPLKCVILRPKGRSGKLPLVITPHGHNYNTELYAGICRDAHDSTSIGEGERDIAVQAVKEGYIAIAPATRGFANTRLPRDIAAGKGTSCRTLLMEDMLVGRHPIGDRVWDVMKLIDFAQENLPVDGKNVIVTGTSGGGTTTLFAGACDERITVSGPSSYFCTFKGSIGSIHHCECNYIPGILNLCEMSDVGGLIAPRPIYIIHGVHDNIFPIEETRQSFGELKVIYKDAGAEDKCQLYEGKQGHRYYKEGIWPFVKQQLK